MGLLLLYLQQSEKKLVVLLLEIEATCPLSFDIFQENIAFFLVWTCSTIYSQVWWSTETFVSSWLLYKVSLLLDYSLYFLAEFIRNWCGIWRQNKKTHCLDFFFFFICYYILSIFVNENDWSINHCTRSYKIYALNSDGNKFKVLLIVSAFWKIVCTLWHDHSHFYNYTAVGL